MCMIPKRSKTVCKSQMLVSSTNKASGTHSEREVSAKCHFSYTFVVILFNVRGTPWEQYINTNVGVWQKRSRSVGSAAQPPTLLFL